MLSRSAQQLSPAQSGTVAGEASSDGLPQTLWRRKWVVVTAFAASIVIGLVMVARAVPMYPSSSRLLFDQTRSKMLGVETSTITDSFLHAQCELIRSHLDEAARTLGPKRLRIFQGTPDIASAVDGGLDVSVGKEDGIISVSFRSPYPAESQAVVQSVVDSYISAEVSHHKSKADEALASLKSLRQTHEEEAQRLSAAIDAFHHANPEVVPLVMDRSTGGPQKSQLELHYENAQVATIEAKEHLREVQDLYPPASVNNTIQNASDGSDILLDPVDLTQQLARAEAELERARAQGVPERNRLVVDDVALINRLRQDLAVSQARTGVIAVARAKAEADNAVRREADLKAVLDAQDTTIQAMRAKQEKLTEMTEALDRARRSSQELDDHYKSIEPMQDVPLDVRVLEPATITNRPDGARSQKLAMAAVLGLLVGIGLALGLDVLDQRLRSAEDVRSVLGLPVLGVVPHQPGKLSVAACGLIAHSDPMSEVAEAARSVRTAVYFASRSNPVKTILVSSPSPGDGKSTFASNLAIAMAQAGSRTLLIDADFRQPALEKIFDIQTGTGMSEVLVGKMPIDRAISRTPIEGLEVLPCGPIPRNPSEMLNSPAFSKLIEQLSERYQCILLDSPPVLSVTDARILGATADVTLFVVRTGQTSRKAADQGLDSLLSVGARVLGAVVNDVVGRRPAVRSRGGLRFLDSLNGIGNAGLGPIDSSRPGRNHSTGPIGALGMNAGSSAEAPEVDVLE